MQVDLSGARGRAALCVTRPLAAAMALALAGGGAAVARDLPPIDALLDASPPTHPAARGGRDLHQQLAQLGLRGETDARIDSPTFLWAADPHRLPSPGARALSADAAARAHLVSLAPVYRLRDGQVAGMRLIDRTAMPGGAELVRFANVVDGIEVFREQVGVLMRADRSLVAVGGRLSPGPATPSSKGAASRKTLQVGEREAVARALADYDFDEAAVAGDLQLAGQSHGYSAYALPSSARSDSGARLSQTARVKPVQFRLPGGLVPAYYVEIQAADSEEASADYYAYVVSAKTGEVLFRHNQSAHAAFSYRVWASPTGTNRPLPGPQGDAATPHPTGEPDGVQLPFVAPNLVTLQNGPISTNDPWLPDGAVETVGNNVDAYVDLFAPDRLSAGDFRATVTAPGVFDRSYDLTQAPASSIAQQMAAITQLFYTVNWLHDDYYDLGFDEAAGNAQADNYGRGGIGGDVLLAEAQDYSGTDNANMSTPADGSSPRMQMYVWSPTGGNLTMRLGGAMSGAMSPLAVANFGPSSFSISGDLVVGLDGQGPDFSDACTPLTNAAEVSGKIVLVNRGSCDFAVKVMAAQDAGAIGVIVANNVAVGAATMGGTNPSVVIPSIGISQQGGADIRAALAGGAVSASITRTPAVAPDGDLDSTVVAHEWGHYISNRLVQNASGLTNNQGRAMGEGWGDFHGLLLMIKEGDPTDGVFALAGYDFNGPVPAGQLNNSYYFGIRRYPYTTDLSKNALSFRHIQSGVALPAGVPVASNGNDNAAVHNSGEVWASMLLECYAGLIDDPRHSFAEAQRRMKRYLVAGYKLTPAAPTFVEARDALLAAMVANDPQDFASCSAGFARRGLGVGAIAPDRNSTAHAGVVESFSADAALQFAGMTLSDDAQGCDADGVLDSGETGLVTVRVRNTGFQTLTGATATVTSGSAAIGFPDGQTVQFDPIPPTQIGTATLPVALATLPGSAVVEFDVDIDDGVRADSGSAQFLVNVDEVPASSTTATFEPTRFDWTTTLVGLVGDQWHWSRRDVAVGSHVLHGPNAGSVGLTWVESPDLVVAPGASLGISFRHRHSFEPDPSANYDGGVLEISTDGGASWTDLDPSKYGGMVVTGSDNPLGGRQAFVQRNASWPAFDTVDIDTGMTYSGQTVRIRFGVGTDVYVGSEGWEIDDIAITGLTNMPFTSLVGHRNFCAALDAEDGDGQATIVGTAFDDPLVAVLLEANGQPRVGAEVRFEAPASGASAVFPGGTNSRVVTTGADGVASTTVTANATVGSYSVTAIHGTGSTSFALTNEAPLAGSAPVLDAASDSGALDNDGITNVAEPLFTGSCVAGDGVQLVEGGSPIGDATTCDAAGSYGIAVPLAEGTHFVAARFSRRAMTSSPTAPALVTIDRTPPAAPEILAVTQQSGATYLVSGTGTPGDVVVVEQGGNARCSTTSIAGLWSCAATLGSGPVVAVQRDIAGNRSLPSAEVPVVVPGAVFADGFEGTP